MVSYPVPKRDTGWGLHNDGECGSQEESVNFMLRVIDEMVERGYPWLTEMSTVDPQNPRKRICRRLVDGGGVPILRPFRQPCHPNGMNLSDDFLTAFRDEGGVLLVIIGNEPNLILECNKDRYADYKVENLQGKEAFVELLVDQWLRNADKIRRLGMIPLFPGLAPTGEDSSRAIPHHWLYNRIIEVLKGRGALAWAFEGTGLAIHNRPGDGSPLDETHRCSVNDHRWIQQRFEQEGLHLPMYGTEAGYEDGYVVNYLRHQEGNMEPTSDEVLRKHKDLNQELLRRFRLDHPKAWSSQWKCANLWLAADGAWFGSGIVSNGRRNGEPSYLWRDWQELEPFHRWGSTPGPDPDPGPEPDPGPDPQPQPEEPMGIEFVGLSQEMIAALVLKSAPLTDRPYWKITKVEIQPQTDNQSVFAVIPMGEQMGAEFGWGQTIEVKYPKADAYAPNGAREWAASMPMFAAWGSYSVRLAGNSEMLRGIGLYGDALQLTHTAHHPTLVYFERVNPAEPPEPQPEPSPQPEPGPGPEPEPDVAYSLLGGLERLGLVVVDLRKQVKSLSKLDQIPQRGFGDMNGIMVHHTGSNGPQTPMGILQMHMQDRGWPTVGYHFIIDWEGEVYFMAPLVWEIHDCGYLNPEVIGIGVMGDFTDSVPDMKQIRSLRLLICGLWEFLGQGWGQYRPCYVLPHSYLGYVNEKGNLWHMACPGKLKEALIWDGQWPMLPFRREPAGE